MDIQQRLRENNESLLKLWHQAQAGDKDAFCQLAESQYRSLFTYGTNFTDDREVIKDAIQEIFIRIWERRTTLSIQVVSIYLFKSLRNQLIQEIRKPAHTLSSLYSPEVNDLSDWETIETEIEAHEASFENHHKVRQAIHLLPKRQQEVVFLKFYKGLENEQIAELMEINRQSVANLLFRALGSLKNQIAFCTYWLTTYWML